MKFISWNVNGLRACLKKGFLDFYQGEKPDFCCLQETKMEQGQADVDLGEGILSSGTPPREGLLGHRRLYPPQTPGRGLRHGQGPARPRGAAHHPGV